MRLALEHGIRPVNLARGAAAAVLYLLKTTGQCTADVEAILRRIWGDAIDGHAAALVEITREAIRFQSNVPPMVDR